jgi:hypothetical protein
MTEIEPPLQSDPSGILQIGIDYLQSVYPLWTPNTASYDYRELGAHAAMVSEFIQVALQVPDGAITRIVGATVYQIAPNPAIAATALSRWETLDTAEHLIPAGTNLTLTASDGTLVGFQTTEDVVKPEGGTVIEHVPLLAAEPGAVGSGLSGTVTLIDSLINEGASWVGAISIEGETSGGQDAETEAAYTRRITELVPLLAPRIITPDNYATAARLLVPRIARALAIDEYDPLTKESDVERCVATAPIDVAGQPSSAEDKAALQAQYERLRERSFLPFVIDPTYTPIDITCKGVCAAGAIPADVEARADAALQQLISPAFWGTPDTGDTTSWIDKPILRYQDVVTALNNVDEFDHYTTLEVNGGTADVNLAGPAALPEVGTIAVTVIAP